MMQERIRAERSDIGRARTPLPEHLTSIITEEEYNNMPANRRWELKNREKDQENRELNHYRNNLKLFGLTIEEYEHMFFEQNGLCLICNNPETIKRNGVVKRLAVDHNHITGKVRGLLCQTCNQMIGQAKDSIEILESAIEYLRERDG